MTAAVVLAGRRNEGRLRAAAPELEWEALIPLAGRPMGGYVVAAVAAVRAVGAVVVAGPPELAGAGADRVAPGADLPGTLQAALAAVPPDAEDALLAAGDAPLLTAAAVADFLVACRRRQLAFGYAVVSRAVVQRAFPRMRRTYVRLREGQFTGGNCLYVRREAFAPFLDLAARFFAARKRPLRLAGMLGPSLVLGAALGTASLRAAERAGTRLLGSPAGAVVVEDAGMGVDVDTPEDLAACRAFLERPGARG
jgi:2-phospho-L-lactate guanylyltransferase (CobY/MobA/RfbA family)